MIRFKKQEDGILGSFDKNTAADWDKVKAEIADWLGESRQKLDEYVPPDPVVDDAIDEDGFYENLLDDDGDVAYTGANYDESNTDE